MALSVPTSFLNNPEFIGEVKNLSGSVSSLGSATPANLVTFTVPTGKSFFLWFTEAEGGNIATFQTQIGSLTEAQKSTFFGDSFFVTMNFGFLKIDAGTEIKLVAEHNRPDPADFFGRIVGVLK